MYKGLPVCLNFQFPKANQLDNSLRSTFYVQLLHHIRNVVANGFFTNKQRLGNLLGGFVLNKQFEHFSLPVRQQWLCILALPLQRYATPPCYRLSVTRLRDTVNLLYELFPAVVQDVPFLGLSTHAEFVAQIIWGW